MMLPACIEPLVPTTPEIAWRAGPHVYEDDSRVTPVVRVETGDRSIALLSANFFIEYTSSALHIVPGVGFAAAFC